MSCPGCWDSASVGGLCWPLRTWCPVLDNSFLVNRHLDSSARMLLPQIVSRALWPVTSLGTNVSLLFMFKNNMSAGSPPDRQHMGPTVVLERQFLNCSPFQDTGNGESRMQDWLLVLYCRLCLLSLIGQSWAPLYQPPSPRLPPCQPRVSQTSQNPHLDDQCFLKAVYRVHGLC